MRKHVVYKIMSILVIMFCLYSVSSVINYFNVAKVLVNVKEFEDVYTEIRIEQTNLVTSVETIKLYSNMIATSKAEDTAVRMAGLMADELTALKTSVARIEELCEQVGVNRKVLLLMVKEGCSVCIKLRNLRMVLGWIGKSWRRLQLE